MEKEFIPYSEALALKELGFDEPCVQAYHTNGENELSAFYSNPNIVDEWLKKLPLIKAPLYQQAFKWFRDKHKLDPQIKSWIENSKIVYYISTEHIGKPSRFKCYEVKTDTYEEAELECLKKLIEICSKLK